MLVTNLVQQAERLADRTAFFLTGECVEIGDTESCSLATPRTTRTRRLSGRSLWLKCCAEPEPGPTSAVEIRDLNLWYGDFQALHRRQSGHARRAHHGADRPFRLRQVDALARHQPDHRAARIRPHRRADQRLRAERVRPGQRGRAGPQTGRHGVSASEPACRCRFATTCCSATALHRPNGNKTSALTSSTTSSRRHCARSCSGTR